MPDKHSKQSFWEKYRSKYRLTILNDTTFEEVFHARLSRMNIITIVGSSVLVLTIIIFILIAYTPVKEFIPGYPDGETYTNIIRNAYKLDSVEHQLRINQQYINNLKTIYEGGTPRNFMSAENMDSVVPANDSVNLSISEKDSLFRLRIEQENEFDMLSANMHVNEDVVLFPPLKGIITNNYDSKNKHFGIDIAGKTNQSVFACYDGTVTLASWTTETGYTVQIQHKNNLISVYKHLESINVEQGDFVTAGKQIGKVGDVGTLSTGPHLHFELWKNGISISPSDFINFN
jgi:murein DD-endopeptidase MepM/ murein hydrolase activator NlpD